MPRRALLALTAATLVLTAGCSGSSESGSTPAAPTTPATLTTPGVPNRFPEPLQPPAEPAVAPVPTVTPAGRTVRVGAVPEGIVADGPSRRVAVGVREPNQLVLLDTDTGAVAGRVPLPGVLRHLQVAVPGGPVLVPDESSNSLIQVALPNGPVTSQVTTGTSPHDATQAPNGTIFAANEGGGTVVAIRDDQVVHTFTDVTQPAGLAPVGDRVGLIDVRDNSLTIYDTDTYAGILELPAGAGPTHLVADKHGRMIATDTRGGQILVYDPAGTPRQIAQLSVPGEPYGITYDPVRDRLWVTVTGANQLIGYDMTNPTPREIARIPTVRQANTVAVDPDTGRLFVTGTNDGIVQIVEGPA
ncbi:DNA-binding beta-propeller fold protein YncE [Pseudonocardia sediminis]|uniref:DNA-binding beta-propeller fold protein YncE n=1 Tax=Pseudonocardia sediminis TaxID=1397368 RepID=A0A4Q7UWA9_PSEST|nr:YncE family protein [Pseudonocardia sediminis]RZT86055.1 DNA-binding beta-propeller fold protein YncE [Pseudonocardia sediminis]